MGLVLTKPQITQALLDKYPGFDPEFYIDYDASLEIAKAQAKKIVKWLKRSSMDAHTTILQISTKDWQALLKEVKGEANDGIERDITQVKGCP